MVSVPLNDFRNADDLHVLEERSFAEWQASIQRKQREGMDVSFYEPRLEVGGLQGSFEY